MTQTSKYINRIRNPGKKAYAAAFNTFYAGEGEEPNHHQFKIGSMAAQAVRMDIRLYRDLDCQAERSL